MQIKARYVVLSLVALFVVACMVSPDFAAVLLLVYFFVGMAWLLAKACKAAKQKYSRHSKQENAVQSNQQARPAVTVTKSAKVPPMEPTDTRNDAAAGNGIAYHYSNVGIYVPFVDVLERPDVVPGAIVTFRQEPENRFDNRAVAVVIGRKRIGYLYRGKLQDMANEWIERGDTVSGRIVRVSPEVSDARKNSIAIDLYFYD